MKNQGFMRKLGDFVLGKGFYIVLFLCVAAIGISGYYLIQTVALDTGISAQAGGDASVTIPDQSVQRPVTPVAPSVQDKPSATQEEQTVEPVQEDDPEPVKQTQEEPAAQTQQEETVSDVFTWPVKGAVLRDFSVETLSLDPTMGDWRTHGGMDIAAPLGQQVMAVSAGTVIDVFDDDLMGTTVILDHGDGLTSTYSNLANLPTVEVGDTVRTGDVIGAVGDTAIAESTQSAHLHLEMAENGSPVNPSDYLPG